MLLYTQPTDIKIIGLQVKSFPLGIKEAFDSLERNLGTDREFYGLSWMDENANVCYYAMAGEVSPNEGTQFGYESMVIEKGEYKSETLHDWMNHTDSVKDIFYGMMSDGQSDREHPCIEWYQSDEKMICLMKNS